MNNLRISSLLGVVLVSGSMTFGLSTAAVSVARAQAAGEVEEQAPVREDVEAPDSPAADEASGNAEADAPGVPGQAGNVQQPQVQNPSNVDQPAVEP
jgi:hypothetical protein